jgi:Mn-dependent DtxR family transcriptional regulator
MRITEATENYMEAILVLSEKIGAVRSVDVANYLGFSKPTISQYMKQFVQHELVTIDSDGHITLTEAGRKVAERTLEKHQIIAKVFMAMGVSEEIALEDACKVEHDLSEETFNCIKQFYLSHIRR